MNGSCARSDGARKLRHDADANVARAQELYLKVFKEHLRSRYGSVGVGEAAIKRLEAEIVKDLRESQALVISETRPAPELLKSDELRTLVKTEVILTLLRETDRELDDKGRDLSQSAKMKKIEDAIKVDWRPALPISADAPPPPPALLAHAPAQHSKTAAKRTVVALPSHPSDLHPSHHHHQGVQTLRHQQADVEQIFRVRGLAASSRAPDGQAAAYD